MGVVMEKQPGGNPEFTQCLASCLKSVSKDFRGGREIFD